MAVGTTRGKRRLGRWLRPIVERSGLKADDIADRAICSDQTVMRLLSGRALPSLHRFTTILAVIGATDDERERGLALYRVADADMTTIQHAENLPVKYLRFRMDEAEAIVERSLDTVIVPGMLQVPEYAAAISYQRQRFEGSEWDKRAGDERRDRQALLRRNENPLHLHVLIHEGALRQLIGDPEIMAAQLDHLLTMGELPNVVVQVVPFAFGAHGAMTGPMFLLSFPEEDEPDSAYAESATGLDTIAKPEDVAALSDIWHEIASRAPSPEKSAEIIKSVREEVGGT